MMDRQRRNDLLRKASAAIALIACLAVGVGLVSYLAVQIVSGRAANQTAATTTSAAPSSRPLAPVDNIVPLSLRPVQEIHSPSECPPEGVIPDTAPTAAVTLCDFGRGAAFVLGPQVMELVLTHVEAIKSLQTDFYTVRLTMNEASKAAFAAYSSSHVGSEVAFIRDGIVVFAPKFTSPIDSDSLEISGDLNVDQANRMVQLLRKLA
jgi:hypothetical protein